MDLHAAGAQAVLLQQRGLQRLVQHRNGEQPSHGIADVYGLDLHLLPAGLLQQRPQRVAGGDGDLCGLRSAIQGNGRRHAAQRVKLLVQLLQAVLGLQRDDGVVPCLMDVPHFASPPDRNLLHSRMGRICVRRSHCKHLSASHPAS